MLTGSQIRRKFLDYFVQHGHKEVHSSSLVPANDPTLLFTNAGMNQFKDVFLGLETRDYNRATTSQKCVRAGGKHNDLENVGFTNRHHTFFEMLGNFSFGDYFKKDAIAYAWELITSPEWFGIDKNKLYVTVFNGEGGMSRDAEAYDLWVAQGVPKNRVFEMGLKDNFWQMGDTGPCGPCSEIHYDMGPAASDQSHTDCAFGCDCGRYVEIWNLVFMQFDRILHKTTIPASEAFGNVPAQPDHSATSVELRPLPKPSIDTGAGLERLAAVMLNLEDPSKVSNYDTDLFMPLIRKAVELTGIIYQRGSAKTDASLRIIADHSRASTFLISDGVLPSNEGRGYVLRKILRRAFRHGRALRFPFQGEPFMDKMVIAVVALMKEAYPELAENVDLVTKIVRKEENQFYGVLGKGMDYLQQLVRTAKRNAYDSAIRETALSHRILLHEGNITAAADRFSIGDILSPEERQKAAEDFFGSDWKVILQSMEGTRPVLQGESAFQLYDTFGLPLDFIQDAARDQGTEFDQAGFDRAMTEQRERARASWKGAAKQTANPAYQQLPKSEFEGYRQTRSDSCEVLAIIHNGQGTQQLKPGDEGEIILDHTPFYAESGGQVGDRGWFYSDDHNTIVAEVKGCYSPIQGVRAHQVIVKSPPSAKNAEGWGTLRVGDKVDAVVNAEIRESTMRNHTATHLLQAGLREVLGKHVKQAGSLVAPDHLRFDFSHFTSLADEELQDIEDLINKEVLRNEKIEVIENVPIDVAINEYKAMALFGEKYGDRVRVIKIGDFSTELCGGTHTAATGEIGLIKVLKEGSVSSGVRRIEAVTGEGSLRHFRRDHQLESVVASFVGPTLSQKTRKDGAPNEEVLASPAEALKLELDKKDSEIKRLQRELDQARMKSASSTVASVTDKIKDIHGIKVLAHRVDNLERAQMRTLVDQLRDKLGSGVVVLGSATNGNVALIVGVTKDLTQKIQAGKVIGKVAEKVGGKGGGRPDLAEAGGKNPEALDAALGESYSVVESLLT